MPKLQLNDNVSKCLRTNLFEIVGLPRNLPCTGNSLIYASYLTDYHTNFISNNPFKWLTMKFTIVFNSFWVNLMLLFGYTDRECVISSVNLVQNYPFYPSGNYYLKTFNEVGIDRESTGNTCDHSLACWCTTTMATKITLPYAPEKNILVASCRGHSSKECAG